MGIFFLLSGVGGGLPRFWGGEGGGGGQSAAVYLLFVALCWSSQPRVFRRLKSVLYEMHTNWYGAVHA